MISLLIFQDLIAFARITVSSSIFDAFRSLVAGIKAETLSFQSVTLLYAYRVDNSG